MNPFVLGAAAWALAAAIWEMAGHHPVKSLYWLFACALTLTTLFFKE